VSGGGRPADRLPGLLPPAAVFLDLDGCLVDSRAAIGRCLNLGLEAAGLAPRPEAELHRLIGPPLHEAFVTLLREGGADTRLAPRCVAAYREAYTEVSLTDTLVVDGVPTALELLARSTILAVVTSKPVAFAEPILTALGLREWLTAVHGPSLEARAEPKTRTLDRALADVLPGAPPSATVMVGDRHHDVGAGLACGTRTVGVTWGIGDAAELAAADALVDDPRRLPELLRG
jgi:phosphoglycolate phosphatase